MRKRLEEVNKSTLNLGEIIKETKSEKNTQNIVPIKDDNIQTNIRSPPKNGIFLTAKM